MKKVISLILVFSIIFTLSGCSEFGDIAGAVLGSELVEEAQSTPHVGFSNGTLFEDSQENVIEADELYEYESPYAVYKNELHFNTLSENEKKIYLAFQYAMENCYTNVLIDSLLASNTDTLEKVLMFFALDTPLLEQNLRYKIGDFTTYYPISVVGPLTANAEFKGYYVTINNFEQTLWDKKLTAIDKAKEIVASLPDGLSDIKKAENLYLHLINNTEYIDYDEDGENQWTVYPYLYDALITGSTHCDGFSNALSLLLNMSGIETAEKHYSPKTDSEEDIGHTWTVFRIGENWYNADASTKLLASRECSISSGIFFAFADELCLYEEDYPEVTPKCISYYAVLDATVTDYSAETFARAVSAAYKTKNPDWALIKISGEISEDTLSYWMQQAANRVGATVSWYDFALYDGATLVLVFTKGLF